MKKTTTVALAATVIASLALAGCSSAASDSDSAASTIEIGSLYEPQNLDNTAGGGQGITEAFNGNVYEGLFKLTDDGDVEPLLASDYSLSDDGLSYTFTLRDDVTFHSGKALTSADVKSSIEKVTADDSQSARKSSLKTIASIETPDEQTVVIDLSSKSISLPYLLSYIWIINSDATDLQTSEDGNSPDEAIYLNYFVDSEGKPANGASLRRSQRAHSQAGRAKNQAMAAVNSSIKKPASSTEAPPKW